MIQSKIYEYFSKNSKEILITENDKEAQISDQVLKQTISFKVKAKSVFAVKLLIFSR